MNISRYWCALFIFVAGIPRSRLQRDPFVTLKQGHLRGSSEKSTKGRDIYSFLGVPYAEPPIGNLRFKDPVPAAPWGGIRKAKKEPEYCLQITIPDALSESEPKPQGSEDCLYLNVFTPNHRVDAEMPVLVFYPGGGFARGGAKEYNPYAFLNEDVVLVVVQHRLSIFGFLHTANPAISGNYGIKDAIEALKWVQTNIREFGGDPGRVTIFGHSSGASLCHILVLSPKAKGLFHGAILQSSSAYAHYESNNIEKIEKLLNTVGCSAIEGEDEFLKCMQDIDAVTMFDAFNRIFAGPGHLEPQIDGEILPDDPIKILMEKRHNSVNLISGRDDGSIFSFEFNVTLDSREYSLKTITDLMKTNEQMSKEDADLVHAHYFSEGTSWTHWNKFYQDYIFKLPQILISMSEEEDSKSKIYTYQFDHRGQHSFGEIFTAEKETENWIFHADELLYLFPEWTIYPKPLERKEDLLMRDILVKLWTNFAKNGNPTPDDSLGFIWQPVTPSLYQYLSLIPHPSMEVDHMTEVRDFWFSLPLKGLTSLEGSLHSILKKDEKRLTLNNKEQRKKDEF